jgi:hypothetical protein
MKALAWLQYLVRGVTFLVQEVIEVFKEKIKQPKGNNVLSHTADVVMF